MVFLGNLLLPDTTILPGVKNLGLVVKSWNNNDNDDDDYYYYISKLVLSYWKCNNNNNIDNNNNNNDNNDYYYYYYISTLVCALWLVNLAGRTLLHDPLKCVIYHLESVRYQQRHNLLPYMIYIFSILSLQCIIGRFSTVVVFVSVFLFIYHLIVHSTKWLSFDWLRAVQLTPNCTL